MYRTPIRSFHAVHVMQWVSYKAALGQLQCSQRESAVFVEQHCLFSITRSSIFEQPAMSANSIATHPWYAAYPEAHSEPRTITRQEVLELLKSSTPPEKAFVLVDLRRNDHEASTSCKEISTESRKLTSFAGRNNPRLPKSASSESLAQHPITLQYP